MAENVPSEPQDAQAAAPEQHVARHKVKKAPSVLVIGSGVAGTKCALSLCELGVKVHMADSAPYMGGKISQLYKQFPTNDCGWCKMLPQIPRGDCTETCLRRTVYHKNLTLLPYTTVESAAPEKPGYAVSLHTQTRLVHEDKCIGCGLCIEACPVEVPDEYNSGFSKRKAVWIRNSGPVPRVATVDRAACTKCGKCAAVCPTKAIDLNLQDKKTEMKFDAIVLATGYDEAMPELSEYGYGKFPEVMTNMELERSMSGDGSARDRAGNMFSLSGKSIGIIQCVGSRTEQNDYCSYACCMYALKEAMMLKSASPDCQVTIFYMDMRTFGKGYYEYQKKAEAMGVKLVQCRVPAVDRSAEGKLELKWTDEGNISSGQFDYVILSIGQKVSAKTKELASTLSLAHDKYGFVETKTFSPVHTSQPGIFVCGSASGPKDIPDSVTEALAVAGEIAAAHPAGAPEPAKSAKEPVSEENGPRLALLLCSCGTNDEPRKEFDDIVAKAKKRSGVVMAEKFDLLCQPAGLTRAAKLLSESKATRLLVAACAPYQFQQAFETLAANAGIPPQMFDIVDIREQNLWVSGGKGVSAKVMGAVARLQMRVAAEPNLDWPEKKVLIIGAGLSGLSAAALLSKSGATVHIVERDERTGGNVHAVRKTIDGSDTHKLLAELSHGVGPDDKIRLIAKSEVTAVTGYCGHYCATIQTPDGPIVENYGAIIVATGGKEFSGSLFGMGSSPKIMRQTEFEAALESGAAKGLKTVAMIQCVGSRDAEHPYCSRVCCSGAIKNALELHNANPDANIYILHRDIMAYGLLEKYYTDARKAGINFVRFSPDELPAVAASGDSVKVAVKDRTTGVQLDLAPDALVLSAGIVPTLPSGAVSSLKLDADAGGFLEAANAKFRPVDTLRDGVFICGLAHSPRSIPESVAQAHAAAAQTMAILRGNMSARPVVSEVSERWCIGCQMCVTACPYGARMMDAEKGIAVVIEQSCRGCGVCAVVCPSESSRLGGHRRKGMMEVIDSIIED